MRHTALTSAIVTAMLMGSSAIAQSDAPLAPSRSDEIVVTAQRSGIPVWRVDGPQTTIVLVGAIDGIAKGTRWDAGSLDEALLKADRVMFPDTLAVSGSMFSMVGYLAKWKRQASLPHGRGLGTLLRPDQYARLTALQRRGFLKPGWERKHPLHLALTLRGIAKGKLGYGPAVSQHVARTVKKHRIVVVPVAQSKAKPLANELFGSPPGRHVPCLMDAVALVEAGPGAVRARSDAWAQRRVAEVMNSPADKVYRSCWPAGGAFDITPDNRLRPAVRRLMSEPKSTVAIISLDSLAQPGGVLDDLRAAGFDVRGPRWRS